MKLHEYQAKTLLASVDIPIPRGRVATSPDEAATVYAQLATTADFACNVKAQLHAGGRGKAGGIRVARSAAEAAREARALLGQRLVTKQTGSEGLPVAAVLLEERLEIRRELYLAVTLDRFRATLLVLASSHGGMDIEEVAARDPQAMTRESVDLETGLSAEGAARLAAALGCAGAQGAAVGRIAGATVNLLLASDASFVEINPLIIAQDARVVALDAKITLDDNALFRHADLAALRDISQEHPLERQADEAGISYVGLDGNIGCLVNGAGLAMATNDIITLAGGQPANFLDVGGGANVEQVTKAFGILLKDARVKAILVNIFGGIMRCDWIAEGLLKATAQMQVRVPIVIRLQGTNVTEGRRLLEDAKRLQLISVDELGAAARKVVELAAA